MIWETNKHTFPSASSLLGTPVYTALPHQTNKCTQPPLRHTNIQMQRVYEKDQITLQTQITSRHKFMVCQPHIYAAVSFPQTNIYTHCALCERPKIFLLIKFLLQTQRKRTIQSTPTSTYACVYRKEAAHFLKPPSSLYLCLLCYGSSKMFAKECISSKPIVLYVSCPVKASWGTLTNTRIMNA